MLKCFILWRSKNGGRPGWKCKRLADGCAVEKLVIRFILGKVKHLALRRMEVFQRVVSVYMKDECRVMWKGMIEKGGMKKPKRGELEVL